MAQQHFPANREIEMVLLALQVFQILFPWIHDWIPLGRLHPVVRGNRELRVASCGSTPRIASASFPNGLASETRQRSASRVAARSDAINN
jgi:hypothetical protein